MDSFGYGKGSHRIILMENYLYSMTKSVPSRIQGVVIAEYFEDFNRICEVLKTKILVYEPHLLGIFIF